MSKFIPLEYLGSDMEVNKICLSTIDTLQREYKIKISQEVIIPAIVDTFIDAAIYESLQFKKNETRSELNLFNLLRIVHEIVPGDEEGEEPNLVSVITLGRMGMRKLEMEFDEESEENENIETKIQDIDIKLLEKISMRASNYLENRHHLAVRDYQIIFKVAEVFFDEMIAFIKINDIAEDTITIFDQFTLTLDEMGKYESIELTESMESTIKMVYNDVLEEREKLLLEDGEIDE